MTELRAKVRFNSDSTLCYIESLLELEFGIRQRGRIGQCLITQVVYTIASKTGIKPSILAQHFWQFANGGDARGFTLQEVLSVFDGIPVETQHGPVWLRLGVIRLSNLEAIVDDLAHGHPIITLIGRASGDAIETEAIMYSDGIVDATAIRHYGDAPIHSYLAIGLDVDGYVILRDSRHKYSFRGYLKLNKTLIQTYWQNLAFVRLTVEMDID